MKIVLALRQAQHKIQAGGKFQIKEVAQKNSQEVYPASLIF